jgi:hypothetical protein
MKCDEPHKTVTKIEVGGKEPAVPKIMGIPKTSSFECMLIFVNKEVHTR